MAGPDQRHVTGSENGFDKVVSSESQDELERAIPSAAANARCNGVGDHRRALRGDAELLKQEVAHQWVELVAPRVRVDESEFLGVCSECLSLVVEKLFECRRFQIRSEGEPHQLALDPLSGGFEQLVSEIRMQEA